MKTNTYKDLIVWNRSCTLAVKVYKLTQNFPTSEKFGLSSQMQRSAVSIASNIAEGSKRSRKEFSHFLLISLGSAAELETQLEILSQLNFANETKIKECNELLREITNMLYKLAFSIKPRTLNIGHRTTLTP